MPLNGREISSVESKESEAPPKKFGANAKEKKECSRFVMSFFNTMKIFQLVCLICVITPSLSITRRGSSFDPPSRRWEHPYNPPRLFDVRQVLVGAGTKEEETIQHVKEVQQVNRKKSKIFKKSLHDVDELVYLAFHPF